MAKKTKVQIDIEVNGKMQKATVAAKDLRKALDGIDKSNKKAAKSAGTLDRNMKGASAASANITKNFSKMAQGGGGIAAVYAQIAAQVFAVSAAFQFLKNSADVSKLIKGQEALGAVTGIAFKTMTRDIQAATGGQLAYAEAAQAAAIGTAAGLSSDQINKLAKAARNASAALGRDLTDSFNRLVRGVTKAEPELLDELGIILRLKDATEEYALSVGKNVNDLSTYEKSQAVVNNVLGQAEDKFGKIAKVMDPSAEALNRFLTSFDELLISIKTGVIDALRPVFDFLSNNTGALVTAFGALAAIVVKSLIPNFGAYAKAAQASSFGVKRAIVAQRKELKALAEAARIAALSQKELAAESAKAFATSMGVSGTQGGNTAFDFLSGASDSPRARQSAIRAIDHMEQQSTALLAGELKERTGLFAAATDEQRTLARTTLDHRIAGLDKEEDATKKSTKAQGKSYQQMYLTAQLQATKFGGWLLKWGGRLAGALQAVLIVGAFAGAFLAIGALFTDLGKAVKNYFFPIADDVKKATKEVETLTEKFQNLTEEMERAVKVREEIGLTLQEALSQAGGAAQSSSLADNAIALQNVQRDFRKGLISKEEMDKSTDGFLALLSANASLIPGLRNTQKAFMSTRNAADINIDALAELTQQAIDAKVAQEGLIRTQQTLNQQLASFTGGKVDPLIGILSSAQLINSQRKTQIEQARRIQAQDDPRDAISRDAAQAASTAAFDQARRLALAGNLKEAEGQAKLGAIEAERARQAQKRIDLRREELKVLTDAQAKEVSFEQAIISVRDEYNANLKESNDIREKVASTMRIEQDIEDKIINLGLKKDMLKVKELELARKIMIQRKMVQEAEGDEKKTQQLVLDQLLRELGILKEQNGFKREQLELETEIAQIQQRHQIDAIRAAETLMKLNAQAVSMLEKQAAAQKTINKLEQERVTRNSSSAMTEAKLASPLPGFVFGESDKAERARIDAERQLNSLKQEQALRDKTIAEAKLELEKLQFELAQKRLAMELDVLNTRNGISQENRLQTGQYKGLTQGQASRMSMIGANADEAFDTAGDAITETFTAAGEAIKASNRELDLAEVKLSGIGQISETVGQSLEDNLTGAFASLIDGSKNFKDAFADMAKAIIADIAKIIAKQLALKAISSFGFGFAEGGVAPGGFQAFANGGIAKGGFQKYANGGVVRRPTLGLVGEGKYDEAIVPLPNGNSIPVDMRGGGSQQNNVTVNVAVEGNGRANQNSQADSKQGAELGSVIATAVQKELQNQKRAGGLLNPMGAS